MSDNNITLTVTAKDPVELRKMLRTITGDYNVPASGSAGPSTAAKNEVANQNKAAAASTASDDVFGDEKSAKAETKKEEPKKAATGKGKGKAAAGDEFPETLEGARSAIKALASTDGKQGTVGGVEWALKLLDDEYQVKGVAQLSESKYGELIERCKELIADGGFKKHGKAETTSEAEDVFG